MTPSTNFLASRLKFECLSMSLQRIVFPLFPILVDIAIHHIPQRKDPSDPIQSNLRHKRASIPIPFKQEGIFIFGSHWRHTQNLTNLEVPVFIMKMTKIPRIFARRKPCFTPTTLSFNLNTTQPFCSHITEIKLQKN